MVQGIFVTGTDTNVGKTVVSAAVMHRYRNHVQLRYWKPIQTGIEQDNDTVTVQALGECADAEIFDEGVRLPCPVSPHLAARLPGQTIKLEELVRSILTQPETRRWVVEGAGGVLVPLTGNQLMVDLIEQLALPVIVVARSTLGTINHTLLTLEALQQRLLPVAGVVMVGELNSENRAAIEQYGAVPVLGQMPHFDALSAVRLREWARTGLDPDGQLMEFLQ